MCLLGDRNASVGLLEQQVDLNGDDHLMALPVGLQVPLVHQSCTRHNAWGSRLHDMLLTAQSICTTGRFGDNGQPSLRSQLNDGVYELIIVLWTLL